MLVMIIIIIIYGKAIATVHSGHLNEHGLALQVAANSLAKVQT